MKTSLGLAQYYAKFDSRSKSFFNREMEMSHVPWYFTFLRWSARSFQ